MKRSFAITTFAVALAGVSACKDGGTADAVKLIPDAATAVAGIDVKALTNTDVYKQYQAKLEQQPDSKKVLDAAKECNVGIDKWKNVVLGMNIADENTAVVLSADGLGKKDTLECIKGKAEGTEITLEEKNGKTVINVPDGTGWAVDDNTVVFASTGWATAVEELVGGKGKPAVDNSLKDLYGKADKKKSVWFAAQLPPEAQQGPAAGAQNVVGSVDLSSGMALALDVGFEKPEQAKTVHDQLSAQLTQMKPMAVGFGVPQAVVDSVKFEQAESSLKVSASASKEDLSTISNKLNETLGSMMGGAGAPPAAPAQPAAPSEAAPAADAAPPAEAAPAAEDAEPEGEGAAAPAGEPAAE